MSDFSTKYHMKKKMAKGGPVDCMACKDGTCMEHGGKVPPPKEMVPSSEMMGDDDLVMRIMKKRYSQGGIVANEQGVLADFMDNDFDDLPKDDHLEFSYTGKNSGDDIGNAQKEEDEHDMISKIMKSRSKKDRMPRPA